MCCDEYGQFWRDNVVDACIFLAMVLIAIAGCASTTKPSNGELRVFWQEGSITPRPIVVEAHVPYPDAPPESTGYTPVTP